MKGFLPLSLVFVLFFQIGCAAASTKPTPVNQPANISPAITTAPTKTEAPAASGTETGSAVDVSKDEAGRLAVQHLALRNARWGKPTSILEQDSQFLVFFDTPVQESRLVGPRVVMVDKESGLVQIKERR